MPLTNIDYSKTIIYKLCCKDISITEIYIGHTSDMRRRKYSHKSDCNNEKRKQYNYNVYQFIRENGGFENFDMIEIERYNAIDGYDASKRERYWVDELKATLNMVIPSRTRKERYELNREKILEYHKKYYENNEEKNKEYRENNKEIIAEKRKRSYENNKKIIAEKNKEKITCECGCVVCKIVLKRHQQSQKHIELMSQKVLS